MLHEQNLLQNMHMSMSQRHYSKKLNLSWLSLALLCANGIQ